MNLEDLENRLGEFDQERAKAVAHVNAIDGAMMELRYWINKLREHEDEQRDTL